MSLLDWNAVGAGLEKEIEELNASIPLQEEAVKNEQFKLLQMQQSRKMKVAMLAACREHAQTAPAAASIQINPISPPSTTEPRSSNIGQEQDSGSTSSSNKRTVDTDAAISSSNKSTKESAADRPSKNNAQERRPPPPNTNTTSAHAGSSGRLVPCKKQFIEDGDATSLIFDINAENSVRTQYVRAHPNPGGPVLSSNENGGLQLWKLQKSGDEPQLALVKSCETSIKLSLPPMFNSSGQYIALANTEPQEQSGTAVTFVDATTMVACKTLGTHLHGAGAPTAMVWMTPPGDNSTERLITGGEDSSVVVWKNVHDSVREKNVSCDVDPVYKGPPRAEITALCGKDNSVILGVQDSRIQAIDLVTRKPTWRTASLGGKDGPLRINSLISLPVYGVLLASAVACDRSMFKYFTLDPRDASTVVAEFGMYTSAELNQRLPTEMMIASGSYCQRFIGNGRPDKTVVLYDMNKTDEPCAVFKAHKGEGTRKEGLQKGNRYSRGVYAAVFATGRNNEVYSVSTECMLGYHAKTS